jgi:RNA polymerase sigma factor (sigma-70 family)
MSESGDPWGGPTMWTLVREAARGKAGADVGAAWETLIERYRGPVTASIRGRLPRGVSAEDAARDFFAYVYLRDALSRVDPNVGRFRCFMQGVLKNFVREYVRGERGRARADVDDLEDLGVASDLDDAVAERREEGEWARAFLSAAMSRLASGHVRDAELLRQTYGIEPEERLDAGQICAARGIKPNAYHQALFRAKKRFREALAAEIRETTGSADDLSTELRMVAGRLAEAYAGLLSAEDGS